jgi:hypothetical protein
MALMRSVTVALAPSSTSICTATADIRYTHTSSSKIGQACAQVKKCKGTVSRDGGWDDPIWAVVKT